MLPLAMQTDACDKETDPSTDKKNAIDATLLAHSAGFYTIIFFRGMVMVPPMHRLHMRGESWRVWNLLIAVVGRYPDD